MVPATLSAEIAIAFYEGDTTRCSVSLYTGNASKFVHCDAYHSGFLGLLLLLFHVRSNLPDTISETSKTLLLSIILPYAQCNSSVWPRGIPGLPPDVAVHMRVSVLELVYRLLRLWGIAQVMMQPKVSCHRHGLSHQGEQTESVNGALEQILPTGRRMW